MINWSRAVLKTRGRAAVGRNYWKYVLTSFILAIVSGGGGVGFGYNVYHPSSSKDLDINGSHYHFDDFGDFKEFVGGFRPSGAFVTTFIAIFIFIFLIFLIVAYGIRIFAFHPLECGCQRVFVMGQRYQAFLGNITYPFAAAYFNVVKIQFFRYLYTFLWSLLLIVPGIIKSYEYRMIPYILAEHPDISKEDAFSLSRAMMDGDKWKAFVLDLSFIGWNLLSLFTCGLLKLFYVGPYQDATNAELYTALTWKLAPQGAAPDFGPGPMPGAGPVPGSNPMPGAGPVPGSNPMPGAGPVSGSNPMPGAGPISGSNPMSGAQSASGQESMFGAGSVPGQSTMPGAGSVPGYGTMPVSPVTPEADTNPAASVTPGADIMPAAPVSPETTNTSETPFASGNPDTSAVSGESYFGSLKSDFNPDPIYTPPYGTQADIMPDPPKAPSISFDSDTTDASSPDTDTDNKSE